ncbi:uncharacterized protein LOC131944421 [Physella acuta]|uniref:uncharacterized protein LOC131944421 n=1 Tax=Physella acuta TaxID=109671 RepID=UPI0027DE2926|nr:uncharacterized protein LOC131944421 [Physella acuta]
MNKPVMSGAPACLNTTQVSAGTRQAMLEGLVAVSQRPARLEEIQSFHVLHSPRIHGSAALLLQYDHVCRRQNQYLHELKELRQQFLDCSPVDKHGPRDKRQHPKDWIWRPVGLADTDTDTKFPHRACILHPRIPSTGSRHCVQPRPQLSVAKVSKAGSTSQPIKSQPIKSQPIKSQSTEDLPIKTIACSSNDGVKCSQPIKVPTIDLDRNQTDYEPIEFIAKRHNLNLNKYLQQETTENNVMI